MGTTKIEWTATYNQDGTVTPGKTWSPIRVRVREDAARIAKERGYASLVTIAEKMAGHVGPHCERVSAGCSNCYAESNNHRCLPANGTGLPYDRRSRDLVEVLLDEKILMQPFSWKKPCRAFVENQSDLFGEWVPDDMIDRVFAVMALNPHVTFQLLTKRPERMLAWSQGIEGMAGESARDACIEGSTQALYCERNPGADPSLWLAVHQPLPNVWMGISCEDQKTADERSEILRRVPAAVRFISQEPQLDRIRWTTEKLHGISWMIIGGESGANARGFDIGWFYETNEVCRRAKVACFLKQVGSKPYRRDLNPNCTVMDDWQTTYFKLKDRKGGDCSEWDPAMRVREFPL